MSIYKVTSYDNARTYLEFVGYYTTIPVNATLVASVKEGDNFSVGVPAGAFSVGELVNVYPVTEEVQYGRGEENRDGVSTVTDADASTPAESGTDSDAGRAEAADEPDAGAVSAADSAAERAIRRKRANLV